MLEIGSTTIIMKIAIVGSGGIAHTHVEEIKKLGLEVKTVISRDQKQAQEFAERYGIETYTGDFAAALAEDIGSVHVCTPPALHHDMVRQILAAGKHVVCEKPLCLTSAEAMELALLAQEKQVTAAIDFNVRYYEACRNMRKMAVGGELGRLCLIHGSYLQEFHALPEAYGWRYQEKTGGKMRAVTEIGSHYIDLVRFLTGEEIVEVRADFGVFTPERYEKDGIMYEEHLEGAEKITVRSEDAALVSFRLAGGAIGNVVLSEVSHGRSNYLNLELTGTKQSVWWNSEDCNRLSSSQKGQGIHSGINAFGGGFADTIGRLFAEVYGAITSGETHTYPDFTDGYRNLAVCEAVYKSSQDNSAWTKVQLAI